MWANIVFVNDLINGNIQDKMRKGTKVLKKTKPERPGETHMMSCWSKLICEVFILV